MSRSDQAPEDHALGPPPVPPIGADGPAAAGSPVPLDGSRAARPEPDSVKRVIEYLKWTQSESSRTYRLIALVIALALGMAAVLFVIQLHADRWAAAIVVAAAIIWITSLRRRRRRG